MRLVLLYHLHFPDEDPEAIVREAESLAHSHAALASMVSGATWILTKSV